MDSRSALLSFFTLSAMFRMVVQSVRTGTRTIPGDGRSLKCNQRIECYKLYNASTASTTGKYKFGLFQLLHIQLRLKFQKNMDYFMYRFEN